MAEYFPRKTVAWTQVDEPAPFRRITMSILEMALLTGIVMRLFRAVALTHGSTKLGYIVAMFAIGAVILLGAATLHLGNFTLRHWWWRAPAFGALEACAEMLTSVALIALHREPLGTGRAEFADWMAMAMNILPLRILAVSAFALVLAGVVQIIRRMMLHAENRDHTVDAISRSVEQQIEEAESAGGKA